MTEQTCLFLDSDKIVETFEALCDIPFTKSSIGDCEPPTKRDAGIEQLIEQLAPLYKRITEFEG